MRNRGPVSVLVILIFVSIACGGGASLGEPPATSQSLSAADLSATSVRLEWLKDSAAESYLLEGRYGDDEYFVIADLPADRDTFTHFLVPGATTMDYRLSALVGGQVSEVGSLSVSLPGFAPNPWVIESQAAFAPTMSGLPDFPSLPTIDPANPDLGAVATAIAAASSITTDSMPQVVPVSAEQEVGPEGGTATVSDPQGVVFTLELPPGAVNQPTTITLTPIETFSEFPFTGRSLGAVQIHPPIPFAGPLRLTIALPAGSPSPPGLSIVGFTVSGLNNELSLAPIYDEGQNTYRMDVYWGDTIGLAAATLDEVAAQAARIPTDPGDQMAQQLAALLAANTDRSLEGSAWIAVQVLQGIVQEMQTLTAQPSPSGGGVLAAPAIRPGTQPSAQYETAPRLFNALFWAEHIYNWLNEMLPPGTSPLPGSEVGQSLADFRTRIIDELTRAIQAYLDDHDGCRTGLGLYAEALRQLLRSPGTPFRQALANDYRARYGPPPELQCEFRLQIARSSIKEEIPSQDPQLGDSIRTYGVHSQPWRLELEVQEGRLFLRGPVGTEYDAWEWTFTNCPPTVQLRPFPTSLIWITDLAMVFDSDDRVSDFVLQGVSPDRVGGSGDGRGETDSPEPGRCRLVRVEAGTNPTDAWAIAFSNLHNRARKLDNWVITGEDSYVATDTIAGRVEGGALGRFTEDTTIVLTVDQR